MANNLGIKRLNIFAPYKKILKKARIIANKVDSLKLTYRKLTNEELSNKTNKFIQYIKEGRLIDSFIVDAFATVREAIYRTQKIFCYKVQIIGAYILHCGDFAELQTGEGKTIVCIMAAYVNALLKRGVHVISVNEYLVERDAKYCAECLNPLFITVGYNISTLTREQKKQMFLCDVTYSTNSEIGFDYLRDNMVRKYEEKVLRPLNYAIVDEGDSVLIDEARVPLIISGQPKKDISRYIEVDKCVKTLNANDYKTDPETNTINLTDEGAAKVEKYFKLKNIYSIENSDLFHKIRNSLMANFIFKEGIEYVVNQKNEIQLIDQFTGRILEGRSYNAGLQQAIQAKEYVKIEPENITVGSITYQSFFRLYKKLAACSGTAFTEEEEFMKIYNMVVVPVPTNKKVIRKDNGDYVFHNKLSKWHHIIAEVEKVHAKGQPILIGTASVEDSEKLASLLRNKGLNFELLNAKNHYKEAEIIKDAGKIGSITLATNMAGRGTDIKLDKDAIAAGGLYVIGTERAESQRIDNQLKGRSGRQGDVGETRFFLSLEDELFRRFAIDRLKKSSDKIEDDYYDSWFFNKTITSAQKKIEGMNFDTRKNLIDYDTVISNQRELIYRQRDDILLSNENFSLLKKMTSTVATEIVNQNIDPVTKVFVLDVNVAMILNRLLFKNNYINPEYFKNKNIDDVTKIINEILMMSIDIKTNLLTAENANTIIRDIVIQNMDFQWSEHLNLMIKIREGVTLRSLEQKSPLNIYIDEADISFTKIKNQIANNSFIMFHNVYVKEYNNEFIKQLSLSLPGVLNDEVLKNLIQEEKTFEEPVEVKVINNI